MLDLKKRTKKKELLRAKFPRKSPKIDHFHAIFELLASFPGKSPFFYRSSFCPNWTSLPFPQLLSGIRPSPCRQTFTPFLSKFPSPSLKFPCCCRSFVKHFWFFAAATFKPLLNFFFFLKCGSLAPQSFLRGRLLLLGWAKAGESTSCLVIVWLAKGLRKASENMLKGMKIVLKGRKSGAKAGKKALEGR
jgi:hypothetical protein